MSATEFFPTQESKIISLLKKAALEKRSVYSVSGGNNWGYNEKQPVDADAWILNLSKMNRTLDFNPDLGILRIEPRVTQKDSQDYRQKHHLDYYVPNTGAGSRGSLLGNALERGFGIAPIQDHAGAILSLRGVLADGSIYESPLKEVDTLLGDCFPWGVGPNLDSLVSQSSWIVITKASLQLQPKAQCTDILLMSFQDQEMSSLIPGIRALAWQQGGSIGSIKVFNKKQVQAESPSSFIARFLKLAESYTSEVGYLALEENFDPSSADVFDFSRFAHRLAWLSPLCPMESHAVQKLLKLVREIEAQGTFQMKTLTWSVLNPRTFALVIPIIYSKDQEEEFWEWNKQVHLCLKEEGFIPYRFHVNMMKFVTSELLPHHFKFVEKFERSFDPQNLLMNGRYS